MKNIKFSNIILNHKDSESYGNVDGLSLQNIFYARTGTFPSCYLFDYNSRTRNDWYVDTEAMRDWLNSDNANGLGPMEMIQYYTKCMDKDEENKDNLTLCVVLLNEQIAFRIDKRIEDCYILFANNKYHLAKFIADVIESFYKKKEAKKNIYWRLCCSQTGFYLEQGDVKAPENFDITELYNDDCIKEDKKIQNFIKTEETSGLVIMHGPKGTGKSSYIKNLVSSNPDKKFVYVPSNIINLFGDPSFGSFLATLNKHIIVLEDCENIIQDRKSNGGMGASAVSLLLNLTDGILSDDLNIKFICTFNDDMKNIDPALLRKGRLVSKYEFKNLNTDKANALLDKLGFEGTTNKPLSLAEIFYFEEDSYENKKNSII